MKEILVLICLFLSCAVKASVTSASVGEVVAVRVEGTSGLITLPQSVDAGDGACSRVWLDLTKDYDRVAYSTFLMAFAANKVVHVRAATNSSRRYGACDFYDVYILK